jgi:geranylgeranyl transferase type-1 subunit beta
MSSSPSDFVKGRHIRYFASALHGIPAPYAKLDSNRLTLVHFATHALDLLGVWDDQQLMDSYKLSPSRIIAWIYSLQLPSGGFQGGAYVGLCCTCCTSTTTTTTTTTTDDEEPSQLIYHQAHIAMAYCALLTLRTLGDDLSGIHREEILQHLSQLQQPLDGSFACTAVPSEHDMRFLYCACAISYMLKDWSGINTDLAVKYIQSCRSFDGGISLIPGQVSSVFVFVCLFLWSTTGSRLYFTILYLYIILYLERVVVC